MGLEGVDLPAISAGLRGPSLGFLLKLLAPILLQQMASERPRDVEYPTVEGVKEDLRRMGLRVVRIDGDEPDKPD